MKTRYVITHLQGRCVCALFYDNVCRELKVAEPENMTGRIYIGRVENVVKNLNCAFIEIEKAFLFKSQKYREGLHRRFNAGANQQRSI